MSVDLELLRKFELNSSQNESIEEAFKESEKIQYLEIQPKNVSTFFIPKVREIVTESDILWIQDILKQGLSLHLNSNLASRPGISFAQSHPIVHTEQELLEECLMFMSGLKSNLLFKHKDGNFVVNPKYRLVYLHKELIDCLDKVAYYGRIAIKIDEFIKHGTAYDKSTQTYEAFTHCLVEYMKYYKTTLNRIAIILEKKEQKFTLVDFLSLIRSSYFKCLDLLNEMLQQIENDSDKHASEKSINLLILIHRMLIARFDPCRDPIDHTFKFVFWLFMRSLRPYLALIDSFIREGELFDSRHELGFWRNRDISISHLDYLKLGYDCFVKLDPSLPAFMRTILAGSFKICKYMEIVKQLENVNRDADICEAFYGRVKDLCPSLIVETKSVHTDEKREENIRTLLDINFSRLEQQTPKSNHLTKYSTVLIESIFETSTSNQNFALDLEADLERTLASCYLKYVNYSSSILISNLLDKFNLRKFFTFLQSYYLFKSNEIMFLFSKSLFDLVKQFDTSYQDDAVLTNFLFHAMNTVFTTDLLAKKNVFNGATLVTVHYDRDMDEKHRANIQKMCTLSNTSRLIGAIRLNVKICWPLNIVISEPNLNIYNRLFLFMMQLKQVKYDLDSLRLQDMDIKRVSKSEAKLIDESSIKKMLYLRFKLMNFINNAHDVLCNQIYEITEEFSSKLEQKQDIDQIVELHEKFLSKLVKSCLLGVNAVQSTFLRIFVLILEFCELWRRGMHHFGTTASNNQACVEAVEKAIEQNFSFAHILFGQISHRIYSSYLTFLVSALA